MIHTTYLHGCNYVSVENSLLDATMTDSSQSFDQVRYNLCEYLEGRVAEVSLDVFKSSVLPTLSPGALNKLDDTVAHLVSNDRWNDFLEDPAHSTDREDVVFANLPKLIDNIAKAVAPVLQVGCEENSVTWKAGVYPSPAKNFRIDGNLHGTYYLANIAPTTTETPPTADDLSLAQSAHNVVWLYELKKAYDAFSVQGVSYYATLSNLYRSLTIFLRIEAISYVLRAMSSMIVVVVLLSLSLSRIVLPDCGSFLVFS